jgi:hypothetical protein
VNGKGAIRTDAGEEKRGGTKKKKGKWEGE